MGTQRRTPAAAGSDDLPDAVRSLAERLKDRPRNPFLPAS
jgi:hypothetical protein